MKRIILLTILFLSVLKSQTYYDVYPQDILTVKPEIIGEDRLIFTEIAAKIGLEGIVSTYVIIDTNGLVIKCDIKRKSHHMFDTVALSAIKKLQFSPPIYNDKKVESYGIIYAQFWQTHKRKEQYKDIRSRLAITDSLIEDKQYTKAFLISEKLYSDIDEFKKGQKNLAWSYELKDDKFHSYSADWNSYLFDEEFAHTIADMGKIFDEIHKFELSEKYFLTAISIAPYLDYVYGELGWLYYGIGQYEKSIEYCTIAVEMLPDIRFQCCIALSKLKLGDSDQALLIFNECKQYCINYGLKIPEIIMKQLYILQNDGQHKILIDNILNNISEVI